jgi:hypothetical protein
VINNEIMNQLRKVLNLTIYDSRQTAPQATT